jgi:nucleoid-associated protein YgaU
VTKEHKLALIVGFALVLFVGVLISDHFSRARNDKIDTSLTVGAREDFGSDTEGLGEPIIEPPPRAQPSVATGPDAAHATDPLAQAGPMQPLPGPPEPAPTDPVLTMGSRDGVTPVLPPELNGLIEKVPTGPVDPQGSQPEGFVKQDDPASFPNGNAPKQSGGISLPPAAVVEQPVSYRKYTVTDGDALFGIARQAYGDGSLWTRLRDFNKGRIGPGGEVRAGVTLELPPKDVLLGKSVKNETKAAESKPKPKAEPAKTTPAKSDPKRESKPALPTYTMKSGDTLGEVAKRFLKSSKRASEIAALNDIDDPDNIPVGFTLKLPAK